ncbi:hypothetical protein B0H19DRAFT_1142947 [Mycena capillaripes]|nr:hypothetical protein B0H19DRAFT_1142947 [Mycena capillaripes]
MTEAYTPSIHIEPPPADEQALFNLDLLVSTACFEQNLIMCSAPGMFDNNNYCASSAERDMNLGMADRRYPSAPALFISSSDSSSSELSPLDEFPFLPAEYRYSPSNSGRSSPIGEAWSPVSSFSGDIFPDDFGSDDFAPSSWHQQGLSGHSSPALSPSLSPITSALDGLGFDERFASAEHSVLPNGPPTFSRLRSSSHSVQSVSPAEVWADGVGRGRSASFSAVTTDTQFYRNDGSIQQGSLPQYEYSANNEVQISVGDAEAFSESLGTGMSWGTESHGNGSPRDDNMPSLGGLVPGWTYPGTERSSADERVPPSPALLTVPTIGLQRRHACSQRRSRSHSDLGSLVPPEHDSGRGRGTHRSTLSIPNSRSVSNGSRASSRDASPHSAVVFNDVQTPASFSPNSPSSPAFEDAETGGEGVSIPRRRTFTAIRGSHEFLSPISTLSRTSSAPTKGRRSKPVSARESYGVFRAVKTEPASPSAFLSPEGSDGSQQEFRVAQPPAAPTFKVEVASNKIRQASSKRRINEATFKCPLESCSSTFTARHNLLNHINSHNKYRPHRCMCGMSFTTQGVLNRHRKRCRK